MAAPIRLQTFQRTLVHLARFEGKYWYSTKSSKDSSVQPAKPASVKNPDPAKPSAVEEAKAPKTQVKKADPPKPSAVKQTETTSWDISTYKVPEYYSYNPMSFYDFENEMCKQRLTQPEPKK